MLTKLRWQWSIIRHRKLQFIRWMWLRLTGKTAYRFLPLHMTVRTVDGVVEQANGLCLPYAWKTPVTCDWRTALLEQIEKEEKEIFEAATAKATRRKARRS